MSEPRTKWDQLANIGGEDDCWNWKMAKTVSGYGYVVRQGKSIRSNRLAWQMAYGEIPAGLSVLHNCDNRLCINPKHLRLGTHNDNMRDVALRTPSKLKKLTVSQVQEIRRCTNPKEAAENFNISYSHAYGIIKGLKRKHV